MLFVAFPLDYIQILLSYHINSSILQISIQATVISWYYINISLHYNIYTNIYIFPTYSGKFSLKSISVGVVDFVDAGRRSLPRGARSTLRVRSRIRKANLSHSPPIRITTRLHPLFSFATMSHFERSSTYGENCPSFSVISSRIPFQCRLSKS